jgi:hypothetical protein
MPAKSNSQPKPNIKRLDEEPVEASKGNYKDFTLIGTDFRKGMVVYISTKADGSDKVDVEVLQNGSATSTDRRWPVVAKPALDVKSTDPKNPLWVAIKLNNQFEDAYQGFIVV